MRRFFQRLVGSSERRAGIIAYLRENGPIAYELDLFSSAPREAADAMLSSAVEWSWKSDTREWTALSRVSLSAFLADLTQGSVLLAGTDGEPPSDISDRLVADWIRPFAKADPSSLRAVISVSGGRGLLFVQQQASDAVNQLLGAFGIDKARAERKAYARLGPASLEAIADRLRAG